MGKSGDDEELTRAVPDVDVWQGQAGNGGGG
jgi:hypothetical protein